MPGKTVSVIGSTGLIGQRIVELLLADATVSTVRLLVRKPVNIGSNKVEMKLVNFQDYESVKLAIDGSDAVFCAVGTTQKKVGGDKQAYRKVDFDIPVNAAKCCAETGCQQFLLVSSVGANSKSNNFYLQLKGEVEDAVPKFTIPSVCIFRPSMLLGKRTESRVGESIAQLIMPPVSFLLIGSLKKYRAINAATVAAAMVKTARHPISGVNIFEYEEIQKAATKV